MNARSKAAFASTLRAVAQDLNNLALALDEGTEADFAPSTSYSVDAQGAVWDLLVKDKVVEV